MAVAQKKKQTRYTKSAISKKVKPGGRRVVSTALVKKGSTNLTPKLHVKRGDTVVLVSGPKKDGKYDPDLKKRLDERNAWKGQVGKVVSTSPTTGKIIIEGVNMVTRATKQRAFGQTAGLIRKEGAIFASRVMLYCTSCKKPTRIKHKVEENGKKTRVCRHCSQGIDS
jgi:large subunit ribosomal protein L24